jgi:hypothetical protein
MKTNYFAACLVGAAALNLGANANANVIFNNARVGGNQFGYDVGMDFTVNSAVTVTALGSFDANISGLSDPVTSLQIANSLLQATSSGVTPVITVGIFNVNTGVEVSPTATFDYADALTGSYYAIAGSIFLNIPNFTLGPGTYSIVATGYNYLLPFGDIVLSSPPPTPTFDTLLGALSLTGSARSNGTGFGNPPLAFPTNFSTPESNPDFLAGTFIAINNVPDGGSTVGLLGLAFLGLGCLRKRVGSAK